MKTCGCVIPFYNEGMRIVAVLGVLIKVKNLSQIICVDDGSLDEVYKSIQKQYKNVELIRLDRNVGKSKAVMKGLEKIKTDYVLLLDADLSSLKAQEIEDAIGIILRDRSVDMIILRRDSDPWYTKIIRGNLTASGERVLRTDDLREIYSVDAARPDLYQLEFAINFYMSDNNKQVYWVSFSGKNFPKVNKFGFISGIRKELDMWRHILSYRGYIRTLKNIFVFCRKRYSYVLV